MKRSIILVLTLAFTLSLFCGCANLAPAVQSDGAQYTSKQPSQQYRPDNQPVAQLETQTVPNGQIRFRNYALNNGDQVSFRSFQATASVSSGTSAASFRAKSGTVHFYNATNGWTTQPLSSGTYLATMAVIDTPEFSLMTYLPQSWEPLYNGSRQYLSTGTLQIRQDEDGYLIHICLPTLQSGQNADYTIVTSKEPLIDWEYPNCETLWSGYANAGEGRWCYDGYYWPSPSTYIPSGTNVYYKMTAAYLCRSLVGVAYAYRLADDLGQCMMDVMSLQQNDYGFFPTMPGSTWLSTDYGIAPGFYDTRFNTELVGMFVSAWERYGYSQFRDVVLKYASFFQDYAASHHYETVSGGWLVQDYYHPNGNQPTHTSLNHQLAEALLLYRISDMLPEPALAELADKMLLAIEDTIPNWIRYDSNLHYAFYPDGTYGGVDYPYLTYNDLYQMQEELEARFGSRSAGLDRLMQAKKVWMDANSVTGYLQ